MSEFDYVLKVVDSDMTAYGGFKWPESGLVECPDWDPAGKCGGGLHGWLSGEGRYTHGLNHPTRHKWLVVRVQKGACVALDGKVKFQRGEVAFCGDKKGAVTFLIVKGVLTKDSNPSLVCLEPAACARVARLAANRAKGSRYADAAADYAADAAANAAAYAAYAAYADAYAADAAANAAADAAYAADAAADAAGAAYAAADAASDAAAERETHRLDKLRELGFEV